MLIVLQAVGATGTDLLRLPARSGAAEDIVDFPRVQATELRKLIEVPAATLILVAAATEAAAGTDARAGIVGPEFLWSTEDALIPVDAGPPADTGPPNRADPPADAGPPPTP